ncbi:hypothetical protein QE152_g37029 [Popillia japonica]|uniref:CCHC-type domain-containing protein n=1 Tax=Popillia japonica TaxID=7064 RepID=A0AAW1IBW2_POPJA
MMDRTSEEAAIFGRRESLKRTPPGIGKFRSLSAPSMNSPGKVDEGHQTPCEADTVICAGQWQDEDVRTSPIYRLQGDKQMEAMDVEDIQRTKRKRLESPGISEGKYEDLPRQRNNCVDELTKVISKITRRSHELRKLVSESTKTKLEIKRVVRELDQVVGNLENRWEKFLEAETCVETGTNAMKQNAGRWEKFLEAETCVETGTNAMKQNAGTQRSSKPIETQATLSTIGTQTDWEDAELQRAKKDSAVREEIKQVMLEPQSYQNLTSVIDMPWPSDIFTHTQVLEMAPTSFRAEGDFAILIDPSKTDTNKCLQRLSMRFPALIDMVKENEGRIDYLTCTTATKVRNREMEETRTTVYILPLQVHNDGINDVQEAYNVLKELKDIYRSQVRGTLNLMVADGLDPEYMRKICEYIFAKEQVNITLISGKAKQMPSKADKRRPLREGTADKRRPTTERIIVKSGNTSYADLLKTVKDKVDPDEVDIQIKTIKKTREGDLLLEVSGDKQKAGALKEAINRKIEKKIENKVSLINNEFTLHVLDIDAALTREEVETTIKDSVGNRDAHTVRVKSMRPSRDGNQIATVHASRTAGNALVQKGRIKIGWVGCRIRERIEVTRCFKCLEFGHRKKDCKGDDRSKCCLNCNQMDHQAKDCTNEQFCSTCRERGHRADSTKCPTFRKLLKVQTSEKKQGRRPTINQD